MYNLKNDQLESRRLREVFVLVNLSTSIFGDPY